MVKNNISTRKKSSQKKSTDAYGRPKGTSRGRKAYGTIKRGKCKICGHVGYTEIHHIIAQGRRPDLKLNKGNLIELCISCHNQTTASLVHSRLTGNRLTNMGGGKCYTCGKQGHWSYVCPKSKSKNKKTSIQSTKKKTKIKT